MPKGLRITFLIHSIFAFFFGLLLFVAPGWFADVVRWTPSDPAMGRLFGAALIALASSSLLGFYATRENEVRILVEMEMVFTVVGSLGALYQVLFAAAPLFNWVILAIWVPFAVAWFYFLRRMSVSVGRPLTGQRPV